MSWVISSFDFESVFKLFLFQLSPPSENGGKYVYLKDFFFVEKNSLLLNEKNSRGTGDLRYLIFFL